MICTFHMQINNINDDDMDNWLAKRIDDMEYLFACWDKQSLAHVIVILFYQR